LLRCITAGLILQPIKDRAMSQPDDQRYVFDSRQECDRLERQAVIAGIADHIRHFRVPPEASILDAGCGSGSMSRLLAARHPDASVTGVDLRENYVAYAQTLAASQGLTNLDFRQGDLQALPFPDASFDLIWSKYVLYFLPRPADAVAEFRRVAKPGGAVVIALNHWPAFVQEPEDDALLRRIHALTHGLIDGDLTARLPRMLMQAGFVDVSVRMDHDAVYTVIGAIDQPHRQNLATELEAARPYIAEILGGEPACDAFLADWFAYYDRPDTCSVLPLWFVQGIAPAQ
jgi:SAM-dependent methyltransferase